MKFNNQLRSISLLALIQLFSSLPGISQCNWTSVFYDSYEYTTVIPYIIPGTTYQNTPQTFAGCVRTGSRGLYLNFVDGVGGLVYSQPFTDICVGQNYRFSFSTRDAFTSTNNLQINVKDASGNIIVTQNVINNSTWNDITMTSFTAPTNSVTFEIVTNTPGGSGNDAGFDDLRLWQCQPVPLTFNHSACLGASGIDIYSLFSASLSQNGTWAGPSALTNGYLGTFTPGTNTNGLYTYTITGAPGCADSSAQVTVAYTATPVLDPIADVQACQSYVLPAITGTNLAGNEKYYSGPGGTGTAFNAGQTITSSQMLYAYGGSAGCSDEESFVITISAPQSAGFDNGAYYCGPGPVITMGSFLSSGAASTGSWSETTVPASGAFNTATSVFNTNGLAQGTYTFTYTIPASGGCPADAANFTITIGNVPSVNLGPDTTLCTGQTITLNAAASGPYDSYKWNNNSTSPTRFITGPGTYSVKVGKLGSNQIVNGDFEAGNTGFTTTYTVGTGGTWGLVSNPGTYAITTSPFLAHSNFTPCTDHTPAPGTQMMVVNGSGTPGVNVWCQNVPVQPNTDYQFGAWVSNAESGASNVAELQFSINGSSLGPVFSPSVIGCNWQQYFQVWNSGLNSSAQICINNQNTTASGNDFVLDDITFKPICYSYDTVVVTYSTPPVVNLGADTSVCEGETVTLDAQNPGCTYLWTGGTTSQTLDVTVAGTYQVTVTNPDQCAATDQVTVNVEDQESAGNDSLAVWCVTAGAVDLNTLKSTGSGTGGTWFDPLGTMGAALQANGQFDVTGNIGDHLAQYVVYGTYCPNDTSEFQLRVNGQPGGVPPASLHLCNTVGATADLNPYTTGSVSFLSPFWVENSATPSNQFDAATGVLDLSLLANGNYEFAYILPADSMCVNDTVHVTVQITENPIIAFSSDITKGCFPLEVNFQNESSANPGSVILWDLGDGSTYTNATTVNHVFDAVDCFDVTLTITADGLCTTTQTLNDMICVDPLPIASFTFSPQTAYSIDPTVEFTNTSVLNDLNEWDFGDGSLSGEADPVHQFPLGETGNYEVQLIVITDQGCRDTTSRIVIVKDQLLIYVPNTFTPDGDEHNNIFRPILTSGYDPSSYQLLIFNRWGEMIFESADVYTGWDGTYHGAYVPNGLYTWTIRFKDDKSDKKLHFEGHVNLIR